MKTGHVSFFTTIDGRDPSNPYNTYFCNGKRVSKKQVEKCRVCEDWPASIMVSTNGILICGRCEGSGYVLKQKVRSK